MTLTKFVGVLRDLLDPSCPWSRRTLPEDVREVMEVLWDFAAVFPEQRRKGRAM
jgi:hypothetical protein